MEQFQLEKMTVLLLEETDSTNEALKRALRGQRDDFIPQGTDPRYLCIAALRQTKGKGRLGRTFVSPPGGLYFSFPVSVTPQAGTAVTPLMALGVLDALQKNGVRGVSLKWVNDLFLQGKKICGILCEYAENTLICGIGVNLFTPIGGFPEEAGQAGALDVPGLTPQKLLKDILESCLSVLREKGQNLPEKYNDHLMLKGKEVTVQTGDQTYTGTALGVDAQFALRVRGQDGMEKIFSAGEVTKVRMRSSAAFFDFDGTLRRGDSVVSFLLYARKQKKISCPDLARAIGASILYLFRLTDEEKSKTTALAFLKKLSPAERERLNRDFAARLAASLRKEALAYWNQGLKDRQKRVLCSASTENYMKPLGQLLGADAVLCTELDPDFSVRRNCKGEEKLRRVRAYCDAENIALSACAAFGDGLSDLPLLRAAGSGTMINPRGKRRRAAEKAGLSVLYWKK